mmetsp:Transcript_21843/g.62241  ORF Transcript_21843/g.62241 Transcript_21843/m.62241 type:complete len:252 (+) Transcript_21843:185-940(+)|eukprot:CAMPEP_0119552844 /NCGR_PEP_ID=MMETSP1352-20130426/5743_1 /TAXON_ID=265584 /ORGANISM="Stauroneis constricta, Strain CCMP1120" /LENGTH=251 /DNA_ID=CAMNT_0007599145 /DNA_START=166 /DNA_END=921 /DNA_ORIENTATION=+
MNRQLILLCLAALLSTTALGRRLAADSDAADSWPQRRALLEGDEELDSETTITADCQVVNADGTDVTKDFVTETADGKTRVDCVGPKACFQKVINNCDIVHCEDLEACEEAHLIDIQERLECEGRHSCHRTEMELTQETTVNGKPFSVSCNGSAACNVAQLVALTIPMDVICSGPKSCRKARIDANDGRVECKDGGTRYESCRGSVAIKAKCLVCNGDNSCGEHINVCKYSLNNGEKWEICHSNDSFGDCD